MTVKGCIRMNRRLLVVTIFALLLTLVVPATADAIGGGDDWWQQKCPDGFDGPNAIGQCTRVTTEVFDAEKIIHYYCHAPYSGPDKDNKCAKVHVETFPAKEVAEYRCPDGYDGPVGKTCTKTVTKTDVVHVDEEVQKICPDGFTNLGLECGLDVLEVVTTSPTQVDEVSCPRDYAGPDANGQCTKTTVATETTPSETTMTQVCPDGFTLDTQTDTICVRAITETRYVGVDVIETLTCPAQKTFTQAGCTVTVPAKIVYSCPQSGFVLVDTNYPTEPVVCENASDTSDPFVEFACPDPLTNLQVDATMPAMPTCDFSSDPLPVTTFSCPANFTLATGSDTLCERDVDSRLVVVPIDVTTVTCPGTFAGPDAAGLCTRTVVTDDVIDATVTQVDVCAEAGTTGPDANGDCIAIVVTRIFTPIIEVPSFTCPAGYDGPDEKWNCSKEITKIEEIDAERIVIGYECPAGARGPNKDLLCASDTIEKADAKEEVSYVCPKDAHGAKDGKCTIKTVEVVPAFGRSCTIKFYDYPYAQKFLFSESDDVQRNLDGAFAQYNNDVESVKVPFGCTVSVARSFNGSGWCGTFGPGVHNLPDDEMSWYAVPGTGCKNW